jgi:hypothetical protein
MHPFCIMRRHEAGSATGRSARWLVELSASSGAAGDRESVRSIARARLSQERGGRRRRSDAMPVSVCPSRCPLLVSSTDAAGRPIVRRSSATAAEAGAAGGQGPLLCLLPCQSMPSVQWRWAGLGCRRGGVSTRAPGSCLADGANSAQSRQSPERASDKRRQTTHNGTARTRTGQRRLHRHAATLGVWAHGMEQRSARTAAIAMPHGYR